MCKYVSYLILLFLLLASYIYCDDLNVIQFYFITNDTYCEYIYSDSSDEVSKKGSIISAGELIFVIEKLSKYHTIAQISDSEIRLVIEENEISNNSIDFKIVMNKKVTKNFRKNEILMSQFIISNPFLQSETFSNYRYNENKKKFLAQCLEKIIVQLNEEEYSEIFFYENLISPDIIYNFSSFPNDLIKSLFYYYYESSVIENSIIDRQQIHKQMATSSKLPKKIKKGLISVFLKSYNKNKVKNFSKDEYLAFILSVIKDFPKELVPSEPGPHQVDQRAMYSLFESYRSNYIDAGDLYYVSKKALDIDLNPTVTMLAYCGIVYYHLERNDSSNALQTTIESIKKYNEPVLWNYYKASRYLNASPSIYFLESFYYNGTIPDNYIEYLEKLLESSNGHKELENYFKFCIAREKEFSTTPIEDVIQAYDSIEIELSSRGFDKYEFLSPFNSSQFGNYSYRTINDILSMLKRTEKQILSIDSDSLRVKDHILSNQEHVIYLTRNKEITIHNRTPIVLENCDEFRFWYKAEIDDKIYWVNKEGLSNE
jgi:hypothetical protein